MRAARRRRWVALAAVLLVGVSVVVVASLASRPDEPGVQVSLGDDPEPTTTTSVDEVPLVGLEPDPTTTTSTPEARSTTVPAAPSTSTSLVPTTTTSAPPKATLLDGEQITFFDDEGGLSTISLDGTQRKRLVDLGAACPCQGRPIWSPDATRFAFGYYRDNGPISYVGDLRTGSLSRGPIAVPLGWTADGKDVVWHQMSVTLWVGTPDRRLTNDTALTSLFEVSSNHELLVFHGPAEGRLGEVIQVVRLDRSAPPRVVVPAPWGGMFGSASPDGRSVVYRGWRTNGTDASGAVDYEDEGTYVVDVATGDSRRICDCADASVRWSPRGDLIAGIAGSMQPQKAVVMSPTGAGRRELGAMWGPTVEWAPSGKHLLAVDWSGVIHVWDVDSGRELTLDVKAKGAAFVDAGVTR